MHKVNPVPVLSRASVSSLIGVLSALLLHVGGGHVSVWLDQNKDALAGLDLALMPFVTALLTRPHIKRLVAKAEGNAPAVLSTAGAILAEAEAIYPSGK